jgi:hypothetical protein
LGDLVGSVVAAGQGATAIQAGGDVSISYAELTYDVRGLPNPYLGLAAFSYAERALYASRTHDIVRATPAGHIPARVRR